MIHEHPEICKGLGAVTINILAVLTSTQESIEFWLRCSSLIIGILVGLLTIASLLWKIHKASK